MKTSAVLSRSLCVYAAITLSAYTHCTTHSSHNTQTTLDLIAQERKKLPLCTYHPLENKREEQYVTSPDGTQIYSFITRACKPICNTPAIIWIHGGGSNTNDFKEAICFFAEHGFNNIAFDARGHGKSGGKRGYIKSFDCILQDIQAVYNSYHLQKTNHVFIVAHSAGCLATLALMQSNLKKYPMHINGAFLLAPFFARELKTHELALLNGLHAVAPTAILPSSTAGVHDQLLNDPASLEVAVNDPLDLDGLTTHSLLVAFKEMRSIEKNIEKTRGPIHIFFGDQDKIICQERITCFYKNLPEIIEKSLTMYEGFHHLFFRDFIKHDVHLRLFELMQNMMGITT